MKKIKTSYLLTIFSIVLITFSNVFAQSSASTPFIPTAYGTPAYGPTLIISSGLPYGHITPPNINTFDYMHSKTYPFSSANYRFVNVNYFASSLNTSDDTAPVSNGNTHIYNNDITKNYPKFKYLDVAIKAALDGGFRRIIILEGVYQVNNTIVIDNIRQTPNTEAIGKITIEGEGFATRITNAPTYLTGAIFQIKSSYNTLKNMSIIS